LRTGEAVSLSVPAREGEVQKALEFGNRGG
jgi:hypothetical protein